MEVWLAGSSGGGGGMDFGRGAKPKDVSPTFFDRLSPPFS